MIYIDTYLNDTPLWWLLDYLDFTAQEYPDIEYIVADGRLKIVAKNPNSKYGRCNSCRGLSGKAQIIT